MADEYILKSSILNYLRYHSVFKSKSEIMQDIAEHEPADVVQVRHGRWTHKPNVYGVAYCSECDYELRINNASYCPNCGAKMDGERKE